MSFVITTDIIQYSVHKINGKYSIYNKFLIISKKFIYFYEFFNEKL